MIFSFHSFVTLFSNISWVQSTLWHFETLEVGGLRFLVTKLVTLKFGLILSADLDKESLIGAMNLINPVVAVGVLWAKKGKDWNQLDS